MPKEIISFGFRHGVPTDSGAVVIDVRKYFKRNPFRNASLRSLRGTDRPVQQDMEQAPDFLGSYFSLRNDVEQALLKADRVYLGCTGGHHRSVYTALLLSTYLKTGLDHRDINKR